MLQSKENSPSGANHPQTGDHSQASNAHTTSLQQSSLVSVIPLDSSVVAPTQVQVRSSKHCSAYNLQS